jgi:hypothetical protein
LNQESVNRFLQFGADFTLSFGTVVYYTWCIGDPVTCDMSYLRNAYTYYSCIDRKHQKFMAAIQRRVCSAFVPLGTDVPNDSPDASRRKWDIVFTGQVPDMNALFRQWDEHPQVKKITPVSCFLALTTCPLPSTCI